MNKFQARLKPSPLLCIPDSIKAMNGLTSVIPFHYLNQEDFESNRNQGIASEFEHHLNLTRQVIIELRDKLLYSGCTGELSDYNRFVIEKNEKKGRKSFKKDFGCPGDESNIDIDKGLAKDIYLNVVQANMSTLIPSVPVIDKTINNNTGGPEILLAPVTLASLPLLKIEITRIMHYAREFGMKKVPDSSVHFHISADMFGGTPEEFQNTLENMIWFFIENPEFTEEFSGRIDDGTDMASIRYMLGDPKGDLSPVALKRRFYQSKGAGFRLLVEQGCIKRQDKMQAGSAKMDDRIKGFFNLIIKDKYDTVEDRWSAQPENVFEYMAQYEKCFALTAFCRIQGIHGTEELNSLKRWVDYVHNRTDRYPHLWNKLIIDRHVIPLLPENERIPVHVEDLDSPEWIEKVLDFSIYESGYVKKYTCPESLESVIQEEDSGSRSRAAEFLEKMEPEVEVAPVAVSVEEEASEAVIPDPPKVMHNYTCSITGKEADELLEIVEMVNGEMANREYYLENEHDLNGKDVDTRLRCEHCAECEDEIHADSDDGFPNAEIHDDKPYCYDCYCNVTSEEDEDDEEDEEEELIPEALSF